MQLNIIIKLSTLAVCENVIRDGLTFLVLECYNKFEKIVFIVIVPLCCSPLMSFVFKNRLSCRDGILVIGKIRVPLIVLRFYLIYVVYLDLAVRPSGRHPSTFVFFLFFYVSEIDSGVEMKLGMLILAMEGYFVFALQQVPFSGKKRKETVDDR